jgi:hypothetical protein
MLKFRSNPGSRSFSHTVQKWSVGQNGSQPNSTVSSYSGVAHTSSHPRDPQWSNRTKIAIEGNHLGIYIIGGRQFDIDARKQGIRFAGGIDSTGLSTG